MHSVLAKTAEQRREILGEREARFEDATADEQAMGEQEKLAGHRRRTKASEVRVVRYVDELRNPQLEGGLHFKAQAVEV